MVVNNNSADHDDKFHMHADMGRDEGTQSQLKFKVLTNPSEFITAAPVG